MPVNTAILPPGMHSALMVGRLDDDDLPPPVLGARVPLVVCGSSSWAMRCTRLASGSSAGTRALRLVGLGAQLAVLLQRRLLQLRGRDQVAHTARAGAPSRPSSSLAGCAVAGTLAAMANPATEAMIQRRMPSSPKSTGTPRHEVLLPPRL